MNETATAATSETPAPPTLPFPGFAQALLILFLFLFFSGLAGIPAGILKLLNFPRALPWAFFAGQLAGAALTLWICTAMGDQKWRDYFPHRPVTPMVWPLVLVAIAGIILLSNGTEGLLQRLWPAPAWLKEAFQGMGWQGVVVGAPLTEEPLFRGVILGGFLLRYGPRKAIAYSAVLFALVHMNPWQFPTAILAGLFLGWLTLRTGSLWPAVFAHFLNNFAAHLSAVYKVPFLSDQRLQPLWMWVLGIALIVVALGLLRKTLAEESEISGLVEDLP